MIKLSVAVVFALTVLMYPMASRADCNLIGTIVRVQVSGTVGSTNFIYMRSPDPAFTAHVFIGATDKPQVIAAASAALALQTKVFISGDTAACPTTGNIRGVGNIRALILNP